MPPKPADAFDVVFVERRRNVRIIVSVPGRYTLADHRNSRGERQRFACRAVNVSTEAIALAAPVPGYSGERVSAVIDHFGKLNGAITRLLSGGFVMSIAASEDERNRLADRIEWFEKCKNFDVADQRADARFIPTNPHSQLILADGRVEYCFVLDLSASGAAVSADARPEIGSVLAVGTLIARVVRHFHAGFAVQFVQRQRREYLEAGINLEPLLSKIAANPAYRR